MTDLVLVTGGAGTLGRAVTPALIAAGYRVRLVDVRAFDGAHPRAQAVVADLREPAALTSAMTGVSAIIHAAAWHGIHLADHSRDDFWELNVRGTYNVYEAAAAAGVRAIVCSSTMGVYGESRRPSEGGPATRISEDLERRPADIYGLSKVITEDLSEGYSRMAGIAGVSLRYGMFVPEPFHRAAIRFLYGGVDERDVATANLLALQRLLADGGHLGALNVFSRLPFQAGDGHDLRRDPLLAIGRHWPDAPALLDAAGVKPWGPIDEVYEIDRAEAVIGFEPRHGFAQYLAALRSGREAI